MTQKLTIKVPSDELSKRRLRARIEKSISELQATGLIVSIVDDLGFAVVVEVYNGQDDANQMLIDPGNYLAEARALLYPEGSA